MTDLNRAKGKTTIQRMARYSREEGENSESVILDLLVTRKGDEVEIRLARSAKGRTTEISLTLGEEERRDLSKLLT